MIDFFRQPGFAAWLLAGMQDGLTVVDLDGVLVFVNDAFCRLTGFAREELVGVRAPFPYWPPEERATNAAALKRALGEGTPTFDLVFAHKSGVRFPVIVSPSRMMGDDGSVVALVATVKDISERKRLERELVQSEQRWRSIAENPFDFVVVIDRDHRYEYVNHTAPGISLDALIGKAGPFDFTAAEYHPAMRAAYDTTFTTGQAASYDVYSPAIDKWFSTITGPIYTDGKVTSVSLLSRDITQQKRAEEALLLSEHQMRESHKLETIGTLAGGIAHDLNNLLTPILVYAELARLGLSSAHPVQAKLEGISDAATRARDLVRRILLFSRRQEPHRSPIDLRDAVREGLKLVEATMPATVRVSLELPLSPIWVLADRGQLEQVLTNLATNAHHAIGDSGGTVAVSVREAAHRPREGDAAKLRAEVVVADSGAGMDAETQRRAFDPFFTTKRQGEGTGLGLSIVHGIVREHGGDVALWSELGKGTRVTVGLPLTAAPSAGGQAPRSPAPATGQRLRVLCVDDQEMVANVARAAIEHGGHTPTIITDPQQALALLERDPFAFDVLISDETMPTMRGLTLIEAARGLRADLPCLLMTGYCDDETAERARALGVVEVLSKPFSTDHLLRAVERAARR